MFFAVLISKTILAREANPMKASTDKSPDTQRQTTAHAVSQQQDCSNAEIQIIDNREVTADLRQLQKMTDNSRKTQGLAQLKALMNSSFRSAAMQNLQAMVDNSSHQLAQRQLHSRVKGASVGLQTESGGVPVQRVEEEELLQNKLVNETPAQQTEFKPNNTGLPDNLKSGIENLSGMSMDNVKVHYNSPQPAQLNALAYAQGTDIHVAPGQEQHLPHEAWHVVQQAQGRVKPTMQMKDGVEINDDQELETEADVMGERAVAGVMQARQGSGDSIEPDPTIGSSTTTTQLLTADEATVIINRDYAGWRQWYYETCMPALQTVAAKSGQDFNEYWSTRSEDEFKKAVADLHSVAPDKRLKYEWFPQNRLIEAPEYPKMNRVPGTNILVDERIDGDDVDLQNFITLYNSGNMVWYRGMSISHFSYNVLKVAGVLGSEGTADIPTFTMDNDSPTRWLPGLYDAQLADAVAHSVSADDSGIREIATRKAIPIGVTVQYPIIAPTHIAYLNDGEQVVRGPISGATVYRVILMGPGGYSYKLANGNTSDLPQGAPYKAAQGSPAIIAWEAKIDEWLLAHP